MSNPFSLEGKVALVTGANTGLGQGIALALAEAGADIAAAGIQAPIETEEKVKALGRRFIAIEANLISIEPVQRIIDETIAGLGGLDILVNNAGLIRRTDAVDFSEQDWDDVLNVNLKSAFFMAQAAGRHFIAQGRGKIINIASMLSFQGGIRVPSYTASKSGIAGITRLLANEWASKGVTTNAIAPGYMATDNTAQLRADEDRNKSILDRIPAARWGVPADLGGTAVFPGQQRFGLREWRDHSGRWWLVGRAESTRLAECIAALLLPPEPWALYGAKVPERRMRVGDDASTRCALPLLQLLFRSASARWPLQQTTRAQSKKTGNPTHASSLSSNNFLKNFPNQSEHSHENRTHE